MSDLVTDEMVETAARAMWERIDREESWSEIYHASAYRRDARAALEAVAPLIASAPDRLDRMERALRGVLELHSRSHRCGRTGHTEGIECIHCETVCSACDEAWPCPTVTTIQEVLGDE